VDEELYKNFSEIKRIGGEAALVLGLDDDVFKDFAEAWASLDLEEKRRLVGEAVSSLLEAPSVVVTLKRAGFSEEFLVEHFVEVLDALCGEDSGDKVVKVFLGSLAALSISLEVSAMILLIGVLVTLVAERLGGAAGAARLLGWCGCVMSEGYLMLRDTVLARAGGVDPVLVKRFLEVYSGGCG